MNPIVVKLGGSLLDDSGLRIGVLQAIAAAHRQGTRLVVVHGGGKHIDRELAAAGIARRTVAGLRVTDANTLDVVVRTLAGTVNKMIVSGLRATGVAAAGISGIDGSLVVAEPHPPVDGESLGHVGRVRTVDPSLALALLDGGFVPVIASIAADEDGRPLNVNADAVASAVAVALASPRIVYLTDVEGLLSGDGSVVDQLCAGDCRGLLMSGAIQGGMRPKLESILAALDGGVAEARIAGPATHRTVLGGGQGGTRLAAA